MAGHISRIFTLWGRFRASVMVRMASLGSKRRGLQRWIGKDKVGSTVGMARGCHCAPTDKGETKAKVARDLGLSRETLYQYLRQP